MKQQNHNPINHYAVVMMNWFVIPDLLLLTIKIDIGHLFEKKKEIGVKSIAILRWLN